MINKKLTFLFYGIITVLLCGCIAAIRASPVSPSSESTLKSTKVSPSEQIGLPSITPTKEAYTARSIRGVTPQPTESFERPATVALGRIYAVEQYVYGVFEPGNNRQYITPIKPVQPNVPSPSFAEAYAFSNYADLIAYNPDPDVVLNEDSKLSLWVGNLNMDDVSNIWIDDSDLLMYRPENNDKIAIKWGPNDRSLLLSNRSNFVLINLKDRFSIKLEDFCNVIGISSQSGKWALWCPSVIENKLTYVVLEQNGEYWFTLDQPNERFHEVIDWIFSPDQEMVLFAGKHKELSIDTVSGEQLNLPFRYVEPTRDIVMKILQWSLDSRYILIHGLDEKENRCPVDREFEVGCWMLIDSSSGNVVWPPNNKAVPSNFDASLSPDNKWIAISVMEIPDRFLAIFSVTNDEEYKQSFWLSNGIKWSE